MESPSPIIPSPTPHPSKKTLISSIMSAAATPLRTPSFKQDPTHPKPTHQKPLNHLRTLLLSTPSPSLWGIPLLSDDPRSDLLLLKFLRARDFRPHDAADMLRRCLEWRRHFAADGILDEDLGFKELEGVVAYMHGVDRDGQPVCYNAYGVFKDREMFERIFGDDEKLQRFLRWRVQVLERGIRFLDFEPGGVSSIIQVTDLKDMPKRELRGLSKQILSVFQDNYPEMVARKIFINVPWYFSLMYSMFSPFMTQRTKSKFVISKEGDAAQTLYKFIRPEEVPVQYGGLSRPGDDLSGPATEFIVKGGEKVNIQIEGIEAGSTITWEIVVGGWELDYSVEFVPISQASYTIAVVKPRGMAVDEEAVQDSYTAKEAGKLVLSVDNAGSRRRKVAAYRYTIRKSAGIVENSRGNFI